MEGRYTSREELRYRVWRVMEEAGIADFPRPVYGRIPNFVGAVEAATRLASSEVFRRARVVKVNPDAPQRPVRELVLRSGKLLVMPSPRISRGFLVLDPTRVPSWLYSSAVTIRGAFRYGTPAHPEELPEIDLVVAGSTVVSIYGERLGKGEGYSELEYGILAEYGKLSQEVPVATTVHDVQVVDFHIELRPWDITVDHIYTPTRSIKTYGEVRRTPGILWEYLDEEKLNSIPLLRELKARRSRRDCYVVNG